MKKLLLLLLFLIPNLGFADEYQSCKRLEKSEKKYLPDVIDRILTIESFSCSKKNNRVIGTDRPNPLVHKGFSRSDGV